MVNIAYNFFQWFYHDVTEKGSCYTFNHPYTDDYLTSKDTVDVPLTQNFRGPQFGLKLVIDAETVRRLLCSPIEHVNNIPIMQFFI